MTLAESVSAEFDTASRTATLTVNFTNPLNYTLSLESITAEGQCPDHNFTIGQFNLPYTINLPATETTQIIIVCTWTQNAEDHFQAEHSSETTIDINLLGFTANFNGVCLQLSDPINIPNIPIV